jgi:hypothetical protein
VTRGDQPGQVLEPDVPYARHRLVLAAAQCLDAVVTYSYAPPPGKDEIIGIWDELRMGTGNRTGWLGRPVGDTIQLATHGQELLEDTWLDPGRWSGKDTDVIPGDRQITFAASGDTDRLLVCLRDVPTQGPDLTIRVAMRGAPLAGYPPSVPRLAWVEAASDHGALVTAELPDSTGVCLRGEAEKAMDSGTGSGVTYLRRRNLGGKSHDAYMCHPPWRDGRVGYMFWERLVTVPRDGELAFYTGLSKMAETRSDGVTYKVIVREKDGARRTVFDEHVKEWRWTPHRVSLADWAGRDVVLRFVTDCGPNDDSTTDHAHWGDVRLTTAGADAPVTEPVRHMTYVGESLFESTFYLREVRTPAVDLTFEIERSGAVKVRGLAAYPQPDALAREFENGVVLVNPALSPFTFDLAGLFAGSRFRRIAGSPQQDPRTNNGQPVDGRVTLDERDGLFLIRQ